MWASVMPRPIFLKKMLSRCCKIFIHYVYTGESALLTECVTQ